MQDNLFAKLPIALIKCGLYAELQPTSIVVYNVLLSYEYTNAETAYGKFQNWGLLSKHYHNKHTFHKALRRW